MEFINVIEIKSGIITNISTFIFPETDVEKQKNLVKKAEDLFKEKALSNGADEDVLEDCVSDGYFDNTNGKEVHIIWSDNVQETTDVN
jgi:hypothetical protein